MGLQKTPNANRLHIGIFGKVNSGKSTLINTLTKQGVSIVSSQKGTTTDPVYKAMELPKVGSVVFIDTAGFHDDTTLGQARLEKTQLAAKKSDIAIVLFSDDDITEGIKWVNYFKEQDIVSILVVNDKIDNDALRIKQKVEASLQEEVLLVNVKEDTSEILNAIIRKLPQDYNNESITKSLVKKQDVVMLVMPQDIQAPKGRLILAQVQTIRDLLDKHCIVICCTSDEIDQTLAVLSKAPKLIICDSQVFKMVYDKKPKASKLTSFSVLFADYKGDIQTFVEGAQAIDLLDKHSKVLIAEACTHAPVSEDIGRVKIPRMLRKRIDPDLQIDIVSGNDFPNDLSTYDLIIHCGACMFHRKYVLSRLQQAKEAGVPITNYGVTIAYIHDILDKIDY